MKLNLLVIRTLDIHLLKAQYELLGLEFEYHQHGTGPFHYASEYDGMVFEIYPLLKSMEAADNSLRLGFEIEKLGDKMAELKSSDWKILQEIQETEWGTISVVQDRDGRKVELKEKL